MSTAARSSAAGSLSRDKGTREPRLFLWLVSAVWLIVLAGGLLAQSAGVAGRLSSLLPWVALLALTNMLPVPGWQSAHLAVDLPIAVAAALVLPPLETALVGFLGAFDDREFRGQLSLGKAAFNRSQVSCAYAAGSAAAHGLSRSPSSSAFILLIAFVVLTSIFIVNYLLVGTAISLEHGHSIPQVILRLRLGTLEDFGLTLLAWGVLGAMLAVLYDQVQPWALLAFLGPTLLSRQMLLRSQSFIDTSVAYRSREAALAKMSDQIYKERSDERRLIAADLHDEVMQPLYKVQLMAHVVKTDLATGRLLEIDEDLPQLLAAAELASNTLRDLIGDLRKSTVGVGGVRTTLSGLLRGLQGQTRIHIHGDLAEITASPSVELAVYQIAKEALTNAISHSGAKNVWVVLAQDSNGIRLSVRDDGSGFDPFADKEGHFGMKIMRERAQISGGHLYVDSAPGEGSRISWQVSENSPGTKSD